MKQPQTIQKQNRRRSSGNFTVAILFMYYMYLGTGWQIMHWFYLLDKIPLKFNLRSKFFWVRRTH